MRRETNVVKLCIKMNMMDIIKETQSKDISKERLQICYSCPLYTKQGGGMCNNKLWLNANTGDVSMSKQLGYVRGCGCLIHHKVKRPNAVCPANKW